MSKQRFTAQQVADALIEAKGFVSVAARRLNVTGRTIRNYVNRYQVCREALIEAREGVDDMAESKLFQRINEGDTAAIIFYAKTRLRHRGYAEKLNIEHSIDSILDALGRLGPDELAQLEQRLSAPGAAGSSPEYGTN